MSTTVKQEVKVCLSIYNLKTVFSLFFVFCHHHSVTTFPTYCPNSACEKR